jgi:hypothetical protein
MLISVLVLVAYYVLERRRIYGVVLQITLYMQ